MISPIIKLEQIKEFQIKLAISACFKQYTEHTKTKKQNIVNYVCLLHYIRNRHSLSVGSQSC
jgi:hypothetical protein